MGTAGVRRDPAGRSRARGGTSGRASSSRPSEVLGRLQAASRAESRPAGGAPAADALARRRRVSSREAFDARHGGFGDAPKFPRPTELLFLLREHARTRRRRRRETWRSTTLRAMALGGMRDHVGGGFHRYSVDGAWRVPHFEKMLYDQAQLVLAYLEAAQASGDPFYAPVAEDTLDYVARDLTASRRRLLFGGGRRQRAAWSA